MKIDRVLSHETRETVVLLPTPEDGAATDREGGLQFTVIDPALLGTFKAGQVFTVLLLQEEDEPAPAPQNVVPMPPAPQALPVVPAVAPQTATTAQVGAA